MSKRTYNIDGEVYVRADLVRPSEVSIELFAAEIVKAVAAVTLFEPSSIVGKGRKEPLPTARAAAVFIMYERGMSWMSIGRALNRHHSSVMAYRGRFERPETERLIDAARKRLESEEA
jgi:chromosomal replication initiation ATPase DnaA